MLLNKTINTFRRPLNVIFCTIEQQQIQINHHFHSQSAYIFNFCPHLLFSLYNNNNHYSGIHNGMKNTQLTHFHTLHQNPTENGITFISEQCGVQTQPNRGRKILSSSQFQFPQIRAAGWEHYGPKTGTESGKREMERESRVNSRANRSSTPAEAAPAIWPTYSCWDTAAGTNLGSHIKHHHREYRSQDSQWQMANYELLSEKTLYILERKLRNS